MEQIYDLLILGGGPGGYTAALYAARGGLRTLVLDRPYPPGQLESTNWVENYPGFSEGIDGFSLKEKMRQGAERFGAEVLPAQALSLHRAGGRYWVETDQGTVTGRALVYAAGAEPRRLNLPGEETLTGKGVHYCAACDAAFYRGKAVAVVGGGNSAAEDALLLSKVASKVTVIHRRDRLRAEQALQRKLFQQENVDFRWNSTVTALNGGERLTAVTLTDTQTKTESTLRCDGLFVSIGRKPETALVQGLLELDDGGFIPADETTQTSMPGFYAVGDVRSKPLRQIVTAVSDGAVAAHFAQEFLAEPLTNTESLLE